MTERIWKNWVVAIAMTLVIAVSIAFASSFVLEARHSLHLKEVNARLRTVGLALHQYHDEYGSFPPVVVRDERGEPMHSWRALILPQFETVLKRTGDFRGYDYSQPWSSEDNLEAAAGLHLDDSYYHIVAIVGPNAAWTDDRVRSLREFTDGTGRSILVAAIRDPSPRWFEPVDARLDGQSVSLRDRRLDFSQDVFLLTADGSVTYFKEGIASDQLLPAITIDDGQTGPDLW